MPEQLVPILIALMLLIISIMTLVLVVYLGRSWFRAFLSGAPVMLVQIIGMRLRGSPSTLLIDAYIMLRHRNIDASLGEVESSYLAYRERVLTPGDLVDLVVRRQAERKVEAQA